MTFSKE